MSLACFRSEESSQELLSLLANESGDASDSSKSPRRHLLSDNDPPLFYNADFEFNLLMEHFDPMQEPWAGMNLLEEDDYNNADVVTLPSPAGSSGAVASSSSNYYQHLAKHQEEYQDVKPSHLIYSRAPSTARYAPYPKPSYSAMIDEEEDQKPADDGQPRRGRPMKQTSQSKMANYARSYREMKKSQLTEATAEAQRLKLENQMLKKDKAEMVLSFQRLEREIDVLRRAVNQNMGANVMSFIKAASGGAIGGSDDVGVCLHMVGGKISVEVCDTCNERNRVVKKEEDFDTTPLFNGDFASIEKFIH